MANDKNTLYCSFCGKSQHEVRKLIAGPTVFICDECVELCMDIIREENKNTLVKSRDGVPSPQEICSVLDSYVIGQDHAKRVLAVCGPTIITSGSITPARTMMLSLPSQISSWSARRAAAKRFWRKPWRAFLMCRLQWRMRRRLPRQVMSVKMLKTSF